MENIIFYGVCAITVIPLFIVSLFLLNGKGAWAIAGFNTLPQHEKDKYDVPALTRFVGKLVLFITVALAVMLYFIKTSNNPFIGIWFMCAVAVPVAWAIFYMNTCNRFKK